MATWRPEIERGDVATGGGTRDLASADCCRVRSTFCQNPAAAQLIARFKTILKKKRLTVPQLDAVAPFTQLEEEGYEQLRSPDVVDSKDMFTFDFELHSLAHGAWIDAEGTI